MTIPAGTTVRLRADLLGDGKPVIWLASAAVEIAGTLDLSGEDGHTNSQPPRAAVAGAGGFGGGPGGSAGSRGRGGAGPGGGRGGIDAAGRLGAHAGHLVAGAARTGGITGGEAYGNRYLFPLVGGSGGGGSSNESLAAGGGGAGGGAILIASSSSIDVAGAILARGGFGGTQGLNLLGGHGSGGAIRLMAPFLSGNGTLDVSTGTVTPGRIRLERFLDRFSGQIMPVNAASFSSPGSVFAPPSAPRVAVTRVGANDVAPEPTASFVAPDVTVDSAGALTVQIAAANVPVGTVVRVRVVPEDGDAVTVDSTPLAGTFASSTATASVMFASGFSRIFLSAAWVN